MQAIRIYTCKTIPKNYIVLTDDGEYRPATPALTRVGDPITQDYIPKRLNGRGAEDITDTPEGRVFLATLNLNLGGEARSPASIFAQSGGRAKSPAKAAAAKSNGRKGGRPRKTDAKPLKCECGETPVVEKDGEGYVVYCPNCKRRGWVVRVPDSQPKKKGDAG